MSRSFRPGDRTLLSLVLALLVALVSDAPTLPAESHAPRLYLHAARRAPRARRDPHHPPRPTGTPSTVPAPTDAPSPTPEPSTTPTSPPPTTAPLTCGAIPSFEDGLTPAAELHVTTNGDDQSGDGSAARPFRTIRQAARAARPGTAIRVHAGEHAGGTYLENLQGQEGAPIWLGGMPGEARPRIVGGTESLHLSRSRWLVVHDLELSGAGGNGLNADDGGDRSQVANGHHLIFRGLDIHDIGGNGNQDCLKLSGLGDVLVRDSHMARCGGGGSGSGVDMVGVHRALLTRNFFEQMAANAVQAKGGSADVEVRWNRFVDAGGRAVNMGGSTGLEFFRPPLDPAAENAEARRIRVVANIFQGGDTPWAFVGCVDCLAAHNTVLEPRVWLMRILQETSSQGGYTFAPARNGRVVNNLFVFRRGQLRADVNVGGGTAPETFAFQNNLWFAADDPARSRPSLPAPETGAVTGRDPRVAADGSIPAGSPAQSAGLPGTWAPGDLAGRCWANPPSIGAFEAP